MKGNDNIFDYKRLFKKINIYIMSLYCIHIEKTLVYLSKTDTFYDL